MRKEWDTAEDCRDMNKLLELLQKTFDGHRQLIYAQTATTAIRQTFPALFCRDALIQEYELVTGGTGNMKVAVKNT